MKIASVLLPVVTLTVAACGRTPLLEPVAPARVGDAGFTVLDGGQGPSLDTSPVTWDARPSGFDSPGELVVDAPGKLIADARIDRTPDVPERPADLGVDRRSDTRMLDTRSDVRVDGKASDGGARDGGKDTGSDVAVDASQANDVGAREGGRDSAADGGPTLRLIAGGPGGPGRQDGTLALAKFSFPYGIASDGLGNLFVAETGANYISGIRKIEIAAGAVTTLVGAYNLDPAAENTPHSIANLVYDGEGSLFFSDDVKNTISRVEIATGIVSRLAGSASNPGSLDGTGTSAQFNTPEGITSDGAGNLFVADTGNNVIRKIVIATGAVTTLAGKAGSHATQDGVGNAARFSSPWGLVTDGAGNLYVAEAEGHTVRKVAIANGEVTTPFGVAGTPGHKDGLGTAARFHNPCGLAYDKGIVYVAQRDGNTLRKIVIASGEVTTLAGMPSVSGNRDGKSTEAQFHKPIGVAVDRSGDLFVADTYNHTIRKVSAATGDVSLFAGSYPNPGSTDGLGSEARFSVPRGVASDGAGNLYVADGWSLTLRKVVVASGLVTTLAGVAGEEGSVDGRGSEARFSALGNLVFDQTGNLLVNDRHCIRRVSPATGQVSTLAGSCLVADHVDGIGTSARFHDLTGITVDKQGAAFLVDQGNLAIRKLILATGEISTLPCWVEADPRADGAAPTKPFSRPWGIATDGAGHLYVADMLDRTVRQVDIATGKVTVLAGESGVLDCVDGIGEAASFRYPFDLVSDGAGGLLVADVLNGLIRRIDIATRAVTTVLGDLQQRGLALSPLRPVLHFPDGLALGPEGELFITDRGQNVVLEARF